MLLAWAWSSNWIQASQNALESPFDPAGCGNDHRQKRLDNLVFSSQPKVVRPTRLFLSKMHFSHAHINGIDRGGQFSPLLRVALHALDDALAHVDDNLATIHNHPEPARASPPLIRVLVYLPESLFETWPIVSENNHICLTKSGRATHSEISISFQFITIHEFTRNGWKFTRKRGGT